MGQSPEELKDNIETTRGELGETLDAIGDRVSPGRVLERRKNRIRVGVTGLRDRVMGTAQGTVETAKERLTSTVDTVRDAPEAGLQQTQGHPMVAGALAFGVGFLIAAVIPKSAAEEQAAPRLAAKVEPLKEELTQAGQEVVEQLKEPAQQAAGELKEKAAAGAQQLQEQTRKGADETVSAGREAAEELRG
jgi:ElaB/YqjD/DUF883 family membrane-anchored ribosome-binding protein